MFLPQQPADVSFQEKVERVIEQQQRNGEVLFDDFLQLFGDPIKGTYMGSQDKEHNLDPNENAARIVAESTGSAEAVPHDLEAAWLAWSKSIQNVDERARTLLRAAFEAGFEAGRG